jgi:hypothetical protein
MDVRKSTRKKFLEQIFHDKKEYMRFQHLKINMDKVVYNI